MALVVLTITSCGFGPSGGQDATEEKADRAFQEQINNWLSVGKNLNEPQLADSVHSDYPLVLAAASCLEESMGFLLSHGADAKVISRSSGLSSLDYVAIGTLCSDDRAARMAELLLDHGADVGYRQPNGNTALFEAFDENHSKLARVLIEHGADLNAENANGMTPLQLAALYGRKEIAELLINHGSDVNARDSHGNTALAFCEMGMRAADAKSSNRDFEGTMKLLQEHGAQ